LKEWHSNLSHLKGLLDLSGVKGSKVYEPGRQFGHLFNAYTKMINNRYKRTGSLFLKPFRRIDIKTESHLLRLVTYIHQNPQKHGFVDDFRFWPYTSYHIYLSSDLSHIKREEVLSWFNGEQGFYDSHRIFFESQEMRSLTLDV
jgi:putative transposase